MGTQWPHALIVVGKDDQLRPIYEAATVELGHRSGQVIMNDLNRYLTPYVESQFNFDATFAVLPHDSNHGWPPSDAMDAYREWLIDCIDNANREIGYVAIDYVHVSFAHDDREPRTETAKILAETVYDEWDDGESVVADPESVPGWPPGKPDQYPLGVVIEHEGQRYIRTGGLNPLAVDPPAPSLAAEVSRLGREQADALRRIEALEAKEQQ